MKKSRNFLLLCSLLLIFAGMAGMLVACGGGGGGEGDTSSLNPDHTLTGQLQSSKSTYNFGNVTIGNTATLSVIISNAGTGNLSISGLTLSDNTNFTVAPGECGSFPYTLSAGSSCAVIVAFSPIVEGSFSETLSITSDDADKPTAAVTLIGEGKAVSAYSVALNQIETDCSTGKVTAYVSVTDQDGFAVTDLAVGEFTITEGTGAPIVPDSVDFADSTSIPLSVAVLMDYSGSVYIMPNLVETIENSVEGFVEGLGAADQAEIIKFATQVQRTQAFTDDKVLLNSAIYQVPVDIGTWTALYDAIYQGIDDTAIAQTSRRAVLVLTDGYDSSGVGPGSAHTLMETINLGQISGVPVFTVGVGPGAQTALLEYIASETGGQFFESPDTDRLQTIYSQISKILNNQYILTYSSAGTGADVDTIVTLLYATASGATISQVSNALTYSSCP